jgi:hyperosmotically inducible periplasmic protein
MGSFTKTCLGHVSLLVALAVPVFGVGCERQSDPPVTPRSQAGSPTVSPPGAATNAPSMEDHALTARVKAALLADGLLDGLKIDVDARNGAVTLHGELPGDAEIRRAVATAEGVEGVRAVVNRLTVKAEDKAARSTRG